MKTISYLIVLSIAFAFFGKTCPTEKEIWFTRNFSSNHTHSIPDRLKDNIESGYAVCLKWKNVERDFGCKVNYAYWNRTNVPCKIDNSSKGKDRNYPNFLGFKI